MNSHSVDERSIFLQALELDSAEERAAFLEEACGPDSTLRRNVNALLEAHGRPLGWLDLPDQEVPTEEMPPAVEPEPEPLGTPIGPYKRLERIGEGGMGTVFLAEQLEPVRRRVALKLIKPGMDSRQVIARFEAERQALALMDHPNIARVLDAGTSDSGRPYFVMELVKGLPITRYCEQARLSLPDRLELFILVCRAVQHAHQKGVIHRDLKPSNILVTIIDGVPVPKVIDFGIAKAAGPRLTEKTLHTGFAQLVGTPLYMSPEQAEFSGVDVDTRSDIYSLGVLLYELLTGTTPFDREVFRTASLDEIRRIIREQEPPTPSNRLITLKDSSPSLPAAARDLEPKRLSLLVRGELDWIVMRALEKDRRRRYESAGALAADVRRYLDDEPVEACPPSLRYRIGKFVRRNRAAMTTAAIILLALIGGLGVATWQAIEANRARSQVAEALEDSALVIEYLVNDVFGAAAPEKTQGRTLTIYELLEAGDQAIPARLGDRPVVEAAAREALGRAYYDLGRYDKARPQFRRAVALRTRFQGPSHPETLTAQARLVQALCPESLGSEFGGDAELIARHVLAQRRRVLGAGHPDTLASMTALARVLTIKLNDYLLDKSRLYPSSTLPERLMRSLGTPRTVEALALLESALAAQVRQLGPRHADTLVTLNSLGLTLYARGEFEEAEVAFRRAVEGRRMTLGPLHPNTLQSMKHLAFALRRLERWDEVIRVLAESTESHRQTFGVNHPQTSSSMGPLLGVLRRQGRSEEMREFCERWLRDLLATPVEADRYPRTRRTVNLEKLALHLATLPRPIPFDSELAIRASREAVEICGRGGCTMDYSVLGIVLDEAGRHEEAMGAFRAADDAPGPASEEDMGLYWFGRAIALARAGDLDSARESFERGLETGYENHAWLDCMLHLRDEAAALLGEEPYYEDDGGASP